MWFKGKRGGGLGILLAFHASFSVGTWQDKGHQLRRHDEGAASAAASIDGAALAACGDDFSDGGERASSVPSFSSAASALRIWSVHAFLVEK